MFRLRVPILPTPFGLAFFSSKAPTASPASDKLLQARKALRALAKPSVAPPKRAMSAFMLFAKDHRRAVAALPDIAAKPNAPAKFVATSQMLGTMWKDASKDEKEVCAAPLDFVKVDASPQKYESLAATAKSTREATAKEYLANRTPEDMLLEKKARELKISANPTKSRSVPRVAKDPNAPTRALTGYTLFIKRMCAESKESVTTAASKWKALSDVEKQPFLEEVKKLKAVYNTELQRYHEVRHDREVRI
ncbi:exp1-like protein [Podochytrium sp. JEL0797]|nr:exp1-like protein [Podochytrium sp. JEL0797]